MNNSDLVHLKIWKCQDWLPFLPFGLFHCKLNILFVQNTSIWGHQSGVSNFSNWVLEDSQCEILLYLYMVWLFRSRLGWIHFWKLFTSNLNNATWPPVSFPMLSFTQCTLLKVLVSLVSVPVAITEVSQAPTLPCSELDEVSLSGCLHSEPANASSDAR